MEQESVIHFLLPPYYTPRQALRILSEGLVFDLDNFLENKKNNKKVLEKQKVLCYNKKRLCFIHFLLPPYYTLEQAP